MLHGNLGCGSDLSGAAGVAGGDALGLRSVTRAAQRDGLPLGPRLPFLGADLWSAYELGWLNGRGKPQVALAHLVVPCESPVSLDPAVLAAYLSRFSNARFDDASQVQQRLRCDLTELVWRDAVVQSSVGVRLLAADQFGAQEVAELAGLNLDRLDLECDHDAPAPECLASATDEEPVTELLSSRLLKCDCPATGRAQWASVQVGYFGPQIDQAGLLRYIVSLRNASLSPEACVERIFLDLRRQCRPHKLAVYARFARRDGVDVSPFRTSDAQALPAPIRTARQ